MGVASSRIRVRKGPGFCRTLCNRRRKVKLGVNLGSEGEHTAFFRISSP